MIGIPSRAIATVRPSDPEEVTTVRAQGGADIDVFVVHGRDEATKDLIFSVLEAAGLRPRDFEDARRMTGKPGPYIGEVLDTAFALAQAVLVLFTPDEESVLRESLRNPRDSATPELQPRPNILIEAGMALGKHRDRTVIAGAGNLRRLSDLDGIHVVRWAEGSVVERSELLDRLKGAGCRRDKMSRCWMTVGAKHS